MQTIRRILPLSCFLAISALPAYSQGLYVEGNVGLIDAGDSPTALDYDTFGFRGGYEFNQTWSVEADLQMGVDSEWIAYGDSNLHLNADLTAIVGAFVRASTPLGERTSLHARLGYALGEFDISSDGTEASTVVDNFDGIAFGAGAAFDITDQIFLRGDYTQIEGDHITTNAFTVGAGFKF